MKKIIEKMLLSKSDGKVVLDVSELRDMFSGLAAKLADKNPIDLTGCERGDLLLSRSGKILTYVRYVPTSNYPHEIQHPSGASGSRCTDGHVCAYSRLPNDEDIVLIIGK